jgi:hypothetical protein
MHARPNRPLLAVRLIGPTATVRAHCTAFAAQLAAAYGNRATFRVSTHHGGRTGEVRAYITLTLKETTDG